MPRPTLFSTMFSRKRNRRPLRIGLEGSRVIAASLALLASCGGGGGDGDPSVPTPEPGNSVQVFSDVRFRPRGETLPSPATFVGTDSAATPGAMPAILGVDGPRSVVLGGTLVLRLTSPVPSSTFSIQPSFLINDAEGDPLFFERPGAWVAELDSAATQVDVWLTVSTDLPPELRDAGFSLTLGAGGDSSGALEPDAAAVLSLALSPDAGVGDVAITLDSDTGSALKLFVVDPRAEVVFAGNPLSASDGRMDLGVIRECDDERSTVANAFWASDTAPPGKYYVYVAPDPACELTDATYEVRAGYRTLLGEGTETLMGAFTSDDTGVAGGLEAPFAIVVDPKNPESALPGATFAFSFTVDSPYRGTVFGNWSRECPDAGSDSGTFQLEVASDGTVVALGLPGAETEPAVGSVDPDGTLQLSLDADCMLAGTLSLESGILSLDDGTLVCDSDCRGFATGAAQVDLSFEFELLSATTVSTGTQHTVEHRVTVSNRTGASYATSVALDVALNALFQSTAATASAGTFAGDRWSIPLLEAGQSATLDLASSLDAASLPVQDLVSTAELIGSDQPDLTPGDAPQSTTVNVSDLADLAVQVDSDVSTVRLGTLSAVQATIRIDHLAGVKDGENVSIGWTPHPSISVDSAVASAGAFDIASNTWTLGTVSVGTNASLELALTVDPAGLPVGSSLESVAEINASSSDTNAANDSATLAITLLPPLVEPGALPRFPGPKVPLEGRPDEMAARDLDGDGFVDLAASFFELKIFGGVNFAFGGGAGVFNDPIKLPGLDRFPGGVAMQAPTAPGEDGVVLALDGNSLRRWRIGADRSVTIGTTFSLGTPLGALHAADLDGDGSDDWIVVESEDAEVRIGRGTSNSPIVDLYPLGGEPGRAITSGDFDGNDALDLVVADNAAPGLRLLLGDGLGDFLDPAVVTLGQTPDRIVAADVDRDGQLDIIALGESLLLLRGLGDGTFAAAETVPVVDTVTDFAVADLDGDLSPDLVLGTNVSARVLWGDGSGGFLAPAVEIVAAGLNRIEVTEANDDELPDLLLSSATAFDVTTILGLPEREFFSTVAVPGASQLGATGSVRGIGVGNFDSDSDADIALLYDESAQLAIVQGDGNGLGTNLDLYSTAGDARGLVLADFDRDGSTDVAVADAAADQTTVFLNLGDGTGVLQSPIAIAAGATPSAIATGDLDLDGLPDIAVANRDSNGATVLLGDGFGGFASAPALAGFGPQAVLIADLGGGPEPELVVANNTSHNITVNWDWAGAAPVATDYGAGFFPTDIAAADFDGDALTDIAVVRSAGISILLNETDSLGSPRLFPLGPQPLALKATDLNADGAMDLVVIQEGTLTLMLGNGDTEFTYERYSLAPGPTSLVVEDVNADGLLDILVGHSSAALPFDVSLLRQRPR